MKTAPLKLSGKDIAAKWDGMDFMERLSLIMQNENLFWIMKLISRSEIEMVHSMHESAREYIVEREDHPIFTSIDLKKSVDAQTTQLHRDKLKAALKAVFN